MNQVEFNEIEGILKLISSPDEEAQLLGAELFLSMNIPVEDFSLDFGLKKTKLLLSIDVDRIKNGTTHSWEHDIIRGKYVYNLMSWHSAWYLKLKEQQK